MTPRAHLIAIGGAGMAPLAELLTARGWQVSGSDVRESPVLERLRAQGVTAHLGHDADHVPAHGQVIVSSAVPSDNPELLRAQQLGLPIIHRSQGLVLAAEGKQLIAVSGAHGKTTTSAMLATALLELGCQPSYAIGASLAGGTSGARWGSGNAFVAEADESDGSFLAYHPALAIITSIEADHLDHYGSTTELTRAFDDFAEQVSGLLVCNSDDAGSRALAQRRASRAPVLTYGTSPGVGTWHVRITPLEVKGSGATAQLHLEPGDDGTAPPFDPSPVELTLRVGGGHNLANAAAAWSAGCYLGAKAADMAGALRAYRGVGRRFELRGEAGGVRVIDDYAHHPTELAATLHQARLAAGSGRVIALFQPHLYSRTQTFATNFADALQAADLAIVTQVYGAREEPVDGVEGSLITAAMPTEASAHYEPDRQQAAAAAATAAKHGDLVLTIGAGDVTELADDILTRLEVAPLEGQRREEQR